MSMSIQAYFVFGFWFYSNVKCKKKHGIDSMHLLFIMVVIQLEQLLQMARKDRRYEIYNCVLPLKSFTVAL
jgi:hypothetical protein